MATVTDYPKTECDFLALIASPDGAYDEGLRFFKGAGMINDAVKRITGDLEARGIDYTLIGAGALNRHGYQRFTSDIDMVLSVEGLERFHAELIGRGYRPAFPGAKKAFRWTEGNVPIEVITTDEFPGDGLPKAVRFPDPATEYVVIDGVRTVPLPRLVELKLASGMTGRGRLKDLADVQELIRILELPAAFGEQLDASVRAKFAELYNDLHGE
ncbi:MAG: hypothetical protein H7145_15930 [Akkermansiaceae bacterium]|nr:hypothetical protein [Armatimonadota bacterium]